MGLKMTHIEHLEHAKQTFISRNEEYCNAYKSHGATMLTLLPDGIELKTEEDFNRYSAFSTIVGKLRRYGFNFSKGGHQDSLTDIAAYAAMLKELDDEKRKKSDTLCSPLFDTQNLD
jgi:hypothetical protein